ncbi:MAG: hypothetical protein H0T50_14080 [Gemmatimonadales bacterium]|nr:hypothetical protein [Gemmatimonadales bacterium]
MRAWGTMVLTAVALATLAPDAHPARGPAEPERGRAGFRLFARALGALTINRVYCGVKMPGSICADSTGSGFAGGGFWPRGTRNQYIYNSGFQVGGIVGGGEDNPWLGDTSAAAFFSPGPGLDQADPLGLIHNSADRQDLADWPAEARVPRQSNEADNLYHPLLRDRPAASQGDVWWLAWDGVSSGEGREHPLGVLLEQRGLGWNFPAGNEDILYFVFTLYNITSIDPADYAGVRPEIREILLERAREFQENSNDGERGVRLPEGGYPITDMYVAFSADMDVADAGENYASVNLPFSLGYTYDRRFDRFFEWSFDPAIFSPPFFAGTGFVGVKYLSSPRDSSGREVGLTNFGGYVNGGAFPDPGSALQLYRYLSGRLDPSAGDPQCNIGNPAVTRICYVNQGLAGDMRFFQSTGPLTLPPGGFGSIVVAIIFAAPVRVESCKPPCDVHPGDPTILGDATRMAAGVNLVDSLAGYAGYEDANQDGRVEQHEFRVVPGSLLGKALVAQAVFDEQFLLPFAPVSPDFFLVPGDGQVTVLWRPSASETAGDPFFETAQSATVLPAGGGAPVPNPLYDPNYRQFDVEGYRVYRGRVDSPGSLRLLAQFDYAGTVLSDFQGQVNPVADCAPELGITTSCAGVYDSAVPGVARTRSVDYPLVGEIVQVKLGRRVALSNGTAIVLEADTAVTGGGTGLPRLGDTGVPFVYIDRTARNNLRYFYAVTAFDLNSFSSGPSSLESPRSTKEVTPVVPASNLLAEAVVEVSLVGRGVVLDTAAQPPDVDPGTGRFSGPFPAANDFQFAFAQTVGGVLSDSGSVSLTLDSLRLGSAYENGTGEPGSPTLYFFTATAGSSVTRVTVPVVQDQQAVPTGDSVFVPAVPVNAALAQRYKGTGDFRLSGRVALGLRGNYYTSAWGRGCANGAEGFLADGTTGCEYNGPRWFAGPSPNTNETRMDPQASHPAVAAAPGPMPSLGNAGELPGVQTIQIPHAYLTVESGYRVVEGVLGGAQRAADLNLFWGEGGSIDSVIDVTHGLPVPFDSLELSGGWGVLNQEATTGAESFDRRPDVLTVMDFTCVEPLRSSTAVQESYGCATAEPYRLGRAAVPGPIAIWDQSTANATTASPRPGLGFALYLAGNLTMFELEAGLPPPGTVWSLRTYVGAIAGGRGAAGDRGPYVFHPQPRPLTAIGAELRLTYRATNRLEHPTRNDLSPVHTVPDPYYVTSAFETATEAKVIRFVNLPADCIIRIYSSSGILVTLLEHHSTTFGGSATWNVLSRNSLVVASGVYFYHIEAGDARRVGRFTVVNFAQ